MRLRIDALPRERGGGERAIVALSHIYNDIISVENLLAAWQEFLRGKRKRKDVDTFSLDLMDNILTLHRDLRNRKYRHGTYNAFKINDPKPRDIHKAPVRDRLLHHAIYRKLYLYFDTKFIFDSYSCRANKGTHKALNRFRQFGRIVSKNHTRTAWVLKCDIKKFFANIDHKILANILQKHIQDKNTVSLLEEIIGSFHTEDRPGKGLPLGNLTSQLFVNIYMNKFDQFIKHKLKAKYYIRYADDFVFLHEDLEYLENIIPQIEYFLKTALKLQMHPDKVYIKTLASGVDFLGWVHFPDHRVLRIATKRRMMKRVKETSKEEALHSYLGMLRHGNAGKLQRTITEDVQDLSQI